MQTRTIWQKLKSTKLWCAIAGIALGIILAVGGNGAESDIQAIAGCVIKIGPSGTNECIRTDADTPAIIRSRANDGYFADLTCLPLDGFMVTPGTQFDGVCYHTSASAIFPS